VSSVSITVEELVDFGLFDEWTSGLLRNKGTDMYRMKGVINARFATDKYVYHAVHMIYNGDFEAWDEEEPKSNKLVFIGKNLDAAALRAGFNACLATPENLEKKLAGLRFKVGDRVECNMSGGSRKAGVITELMYRSNDMEQGQVCPYKVRAASVPQAVPPPSLASRKPCLPPLPPARASLSLASDPSPPAPPVAGGPGRRYGHVGAV
jgi:hypothetical protein